MFKGMNIHYEMDDRNKGIACGGIGVIYLMAKRLGLAKEIDKHLHLLKRHLPYPESDHVLNLTYNVLAGGTRLEDIESQRQDEGWMDALGAEVIPDPTTAGDFLRRFTELDVVGLMNRGDVRAERTWQSSVLLPRLNNVKHAVHERPPDLNTSNSIRELGYSRIGRQVPCPSNRRMSVEDFNWDGN